MLSILRIRVHNILLHKNLTLKRLHVRGQYLKSHSCIIRHDYFFKNPTHYFPRKCNFDCISCKCNAFACIVFYVWVIYLYKVKLVGESSAPTGADPIAMMEYYMKKAAQEEKQRPPKPSKDEMPPPASLQGLHPLNLLSGCIHVLGCSPF